MNNIGTRAKQSSMIEVIGLGAGSHCGVMVDTLLYSTEIRVIGLLDNEETLWDTHAHGIRVLGGDSEIPSLISLGITTCFIGVGGANTTDLREKLFNKATHFGLDVINTIHPNASISRSCKLFNGVTVLSGAIINTNATIGNNVLINTGAIVEHDCRIENHVHIATAARLAGAVTVGQGSHIGIGATIKENINVGVKSVVGAGSVFVHDVPDYTTVVGVPAKPI